MEDFGKSLESFGDPNRFALELGFEVEKIVDDEVDLTPPSDFDIFLAKGADLNEEISEMETAKFMIRLQNDDYPDYGEARICIHVARWRADEVLKIIQSENAHASLQNMLSELKSKWFINRWGEREAIRLYRGLWVLAEKYRSKTLDVLINKWMLEMEVDQNSESQAYLRFKRNLSL